VKHSIRRYVHLKIIIKEEGNRQTARDSVLTENITGRNETVMD